MTEQPMERGTVLFKCPSCLKYDIKRTAHERKIATKYTCPLCGFTGPN
ncbi:RNA-binding protein [Candidatus Woesearchaeota archaeon]|nr:RNA-binding protein [Candidatus Woesearchaeota archaeon]MBW3016033.1 RNA-binding protein [Candidatus Woesearchaeota archaeon]